MTHAIISGAGGFIGRALTEYLLMQGWSITALVRDPDKFADLHSPQLRLITCKLQDYAQLPTLLKGIVPAEALFFHLAWQGLGSSAYADLSLQLPNIEASVWAADAAAASACRRFIFMGSSYEVQALEPLDSLSAPLPSCIYSATKHAAAVMCRTRAVCKGLEFIHLLPANTFGPGDHSLRSANMIINYFLHHLSPPRLVSGKALNDWLYIKDAVRLIEAAAVKGHNLRSYYVGSLKPRPLREIICAVRDALLPGTELNFGTMPDPIALDYSKLPVKQLYEDTGICADYPFAKAVLESADWVRTLKLEL